MSRISDLTRARLRARARLKRQFAMIKRRFPAASGFVNWMEADRSRIIRLPFAILLILCGILSFLPVLGLWMLPLGIMLLALDLPFLQAPVSAMMIRLRRRFGSWLRPRRG